MVTMMDTSTLHYSDCMPVPPAPADLTDEQLEALLAGPVPDVTGDLTRRDMLLVLVRNRITLGRITDADLVRVAG